MITNEQLRNIPGLNAYDGAHNKIGKIGQIYVDDRTGRPEWMTVRTGLFGSKETFVPLEPAEVHEGEVMVPFQKEQIADAPAIDTEAGGHLSQQEEDRLFRYYGLSGAGEPQAAGQASGQYTSGAPTAQTSRLDQPAGAKARPTDDAMTRSEEHLRVGTQSTETGRARLHKVVVTENEQQTVPVRREKAHLEREPITDANRDRAMAGPEFTESDVEVVLHEERPVVSKETVPVERVHLAKETVTENETVGGQVRRERIESELPPDEEQQR